MVASRVTHNMKTIGIGRVAVHGSFAPNGGSALVAASTNGKGFSVARVTTGQFRITFDNEYPELVDAVASVQNADATPTRVQFGDYVAGSKTLDMYVQQAATGAVSEQKGIIPLPLDRWTEFPKIVNLPLGDLVPDPSNPPVAVVTGDCIAWGFDADNEKLGVSFRVPDDWDGASNLTMKVVWHPQSGTAVGDTETVIWTFSYHVLNKTGEAVDNGTDVDATGTYTQSGGAGTDKEVNVTDISLVYTGGNQPIVAGDVLTGQFGIDFTNMTYAADVMAMELELSYNSSAPGLVGPKLQRVNSTTDPALRLVWPAADVSDLQFLGGIVKPPEMDAASDITAHVLAKLSGAVDGMPMTFSTYDGIGDTKLTDSTATDLSNALGEHIATIANADIAASPGFLNMLLAPAAHGTDAAEIYAVWLEYTRADWATTGQIWANADLTVDANTRINFDVKFRNTSVDY